MPADTFGTTVAPVRDGRRFRLVQSGGCDARPPLDTLLGRDRRRRTTYYVRVSIVDRKELADVDAIVD